MPLLARLRVVKAHSGCCTHLPMARALTGPSIQDDMSTTMRLRSNTVASDLMWLWGWLVVAVPPALEPE